MDLQYKRADRLMRLLLTLLSTMMSSAVVLYLAAMIARVSPASTLEQTSNKNQEEAMEGSSERTGTKMVSTVLFGTGWNNIYRTARHYDKRFFGTSATTGVKYIDGAVLAVHVHVGLKYTIL